MKLPGLTPIYRLPGEKRRVLEPLTSPAHIRRNRAAIAVRMGAREGPGKVASSEDFETMSRVPSLSSPFLLGFDEIERLLDRVTKGADGYPPYNIERLARDGNNPERLRITLAVAGFTRDQLDVCIEESQLVIRGRQQDDKSRQYLHRGIAALLAGDIASTAKIASLSRESRSLRAISGSRSKRATRASALR